MTRQEIESQYHVENGVIRSPGKFENCPVYAPYFYDAMLNGDGDTIADDAIRFAVTADDVAEFPELQNEQFVELTEDDIGFVYIR